MQIIKNVFSEDILEFINKDLKKYQWTLTGTSNSKDNNKPLFWYKDLISSETKNLFKTKINKHTGKNIEINRIYCNGQAHGQCGFWHRDVDESCVNKFSLIYFYKKWLPEYGGHFMVQINEEIISVLPELNSAILFDSRLLHMALGASRHCLEQRESLAVKFTVYE